jgi:hypothetical protein
MVVTSPLSHCFLKTLAISSLNPKILREFPAKPVISIRDEGEGYPFSGGKAEGEA